MKLKKLLATLAILATWPAHAELLPLPPFLPGGDASHPAYETPAQRDARVERTRCHYAPVWWFPACRWVQPLKKL